MQTIFTNRDQINCIFSFTFIYCCNHAVGAPQTGFNVREFDAFDITVFVVFLVYQKK